MSRGEVVGSTTGTSWVKNFYAVFRVSLRMCEFMERRHAFGAQGRARGALVRGVGAAA